MRKIDDSLEPLAKSPGRADAAQAVQPSHIEHGQRDGASGSRYDEHPDYIRSLGEAVNRVMTNIEWTTTTLSIIDAQIDARGKQGGVMLAAVVGDNVHGLPPGLEPQHVDLGEVIGNMNPDGSCEVWNSVVSRDEIKVRVRAAQSALRDQSVAAGNTRPVAENAPTQSSVTVGIVSLPMHTLLMESMKAIGRTPAGADDPEFVQSVVDFLDVPVGGLHTFPGRYAPAIRDGLKKFDVPVVPPEVRDDLRAMIKRVDDHCNSQGVKR